MTIALSVCDDDGQRGDLAFGTIPQMLSHSAETFGPRLAVVDHDKRLSYTSLAEEVFEATRAMIAMGVDRGDRVAIWAPNMWEWIVVALAVHCAGGVVVPVNTRYKGHEAAYLLNRSRAKLLFTVNGFLNTSYVDLLRRSGEAVPHLEATVVLRGGTGPDTMSFEQFVALAENTPDDEAHDRHVEVEPTDLCDILFTSGTTGHPKGVMCTHAQTLRAFRDWSDVVGLQTGDRYLVVLPFFHTFGYKAGWLSSLMMGATVFPEPIFDVEVVLQRIGKDEITVLPGPPALYQSILQRDDFDNYHLDSLRLAVTGAAVIPVQLIRDMRSRLTFDTIITGYGLTECTGVVAMCRHQDDPETIATTSGRAIPGVEIRIFDADNNPVAPDEPGEIVVRGYNVTSGYFEDPEQTKATIDPDGWLHTGDIGSLDADGYIKITDRKKDMYIVGGFNAYPAEIETSLLNHDAIAEVAVVGMPDDRLGEVGKAFVVLRDGASLEPDDMIAWCRDRMANFKVPRHVSFIDTLPRNATGKVQKFKLRDSEGDA